MIIILYRVAVQARMSQAHIYARRFYLHLHCKTMLCIFQV